MTDEFRAYWDPMGDSNRKHLIHRCFVDSDDPKDHGAIEHLLNYSTGTVGFVGLFLDGDLGDAYSEVSFLENFGMYLGIVSHHICDICTPVHVGHRLNFQSPAARPRVSVFAIFRARCLVYSPSRHAARG